MVVDDAFACATTTRHLLEVCLNNMPDSGSSRVGYDACITLPGPQEAFLAVLVPWQIICSECHLSLPQ